MSTRASEPAREGHEGEGHQAVGREALGHEDQRAGTKHSRKVSRIAALGIALGAVGQWFAARTTWLKVVAFDDKTGDVTRSIPGASWSTATTALAALLLVAAIAGLSLKKIGRRLAGAVAAIAAVIASWPATHLALYGADPQRAHSLLVDGLTSSKATEPQTISQWATIQDMQVNYVATVVFVVFCALALVSSIVLAMRPGEDTAKANRFERKADREAKLAEDLAQSPDSGRVMWDALDADLDPTDDLPPTDPDAPEAPQAQERP